MPTNLYEKTLNLLRSRPVSLELKDIADAIEVTPSWLSAFNNGRIADPKYSKLQKLHDYLISVGK